MTESANKKLWNTECKFTNHLWSSCSVEDEARKNENKEEKWFKTPNEVQAKETTRPRLVTINWFVIFIEGRSGCEHQRVDDDKRMNALAYTQAVARY